LGRLWRRLELALGAEPIADRAALETFLEQRAALIAQKCAIDYCRGKTGLASYALFTEKPFLDALEICRWETFSVALGDLILVAEGHLRPHVVPARRPLLYDALTELYSALITRNPVPAHRAQGWEDAVASFSARLKTTSAGNPPGALDVADHSARRLFETLPIHASMRKLDEEVVYGAVRFRMIAVNQEMQRRLAPTDLVQQLLARQNVTL
jgi:hypothetical protein